MTDPEILKHTRESGDFSRMLDAVPYAKWIGLQCERFGDDLIFRLPKKKKTSATPSCPPSTVA